MICSLILAEDEYSRRLFATETAEEAEEVDLIVADLGV